MSTEFLLAIALLLFCTMIAIVWNRGAILAVILLPASELLGLLDPMSMAIKGVFDIHALTMIFVMLMLVASMARVSDFGEAKFFAPFLVLAAFWLYGWIMPVVRGESTALQSLEASKEFMMLFAYPAAFLFLRTQRELQLAWRLLIGLGAYYCVLEIVAQFAGPGLLNRLTYFYRADDFGLWKVYVQFWAVILYFFLYYFFLYLIGGRFRFVMILLGAVGMFLTFYRSYLLAMVVAIPVVLMLARASLTRMIKAGTGALVGLFAVIAATAVLATGRTSDIAEIGDALVFSGIEDITRGSGGSLEGRREHGAELYNLADRRPWFGYGFINQQSQLASKLNLPGFSASVLGFVDKGAADIVVKFGYLGGALVYLTFGWIALRSIGIAIRAPVADLSSKALSIAAVIVISFIVQPVHAPLTYSFALLPLALAMGIVEREFLETQRRGGAAG